MQKPLFFTKIESNLRLSQNMPSYPSLQVHSNGCWHPPFTQPGKQIHWLHSGPAHPIQHSQVFGAVQFPFPLHPGSQMGTVQNNASFDQPGMHTIFPYLSQM